MNGLPPRGGASPQHERPAPSSLRSPLVYVHCPACAQRIKEPFSRTSGPVTWMHHRPDVTKRCRVVIIPDPVGENHRGIVVLTDQSLEDALLAQLKNWALRN